MNADNAEVTAAFYPAADSTTSASECVPWQGRVLSPASPSYKFAPVPGAEIRLHQIVTPCNAGPLPQCSDLVDLTTYTAATDFQRTSVPVLALTDKQGVFALPALPRECVYYLTAEVPHLPMQPFTVSTKQRVDPAGNPKPYEDHHVVLTTQTKVNVFIEPTSATAHQSPLPRKARLTAYNRIAVSPDVTYRRDTTTEVDLDEKGCAVATRYDMPPSRTFLSVTIEGETTPTAVRVLPLSPGETNITLRYTF